jgi:hypothetical protein
MAPMMRQAAARRRASVFMFAPVNDVGVVMSFKNGLGTFCDTQHLPVLLKISLRPSDTIKMPFRKLNSNL